MTVAHDAHTKTGGGWTTTPDPFDFTHTPSGTPRGVLLMILQNGSATSGIVSCTYGGVAMSLIGSAADTATEIGLAILYFLGGGIPTGAQTVSIDHTAAAVGKIAVCATVTAATDTVVDGWAIAEQNQANPQVALIGTGGEGLRYCFIHSGLANVSDLALLSGMTAVDSNDAGALIQRWDRETTASAGSFTMGYTAVTDDVALFGVKIDEVTAVITRRRPTMVRFAATRAASY